MALIAVGSVEQYADAVRALFPPGEFWSTQLDDPESDLSAFVRVKAAEIARFQLRRAALLAEALPATATQETIDDWERTFGIANRGASLAVRRNDVLARPRPVVSREDLRTVVEQSGATLDRCGHPYRPAHFGHTRFRSRAGGPSALVRIELRITLADRSRRAEMEAEVRRVALACYRINFLYRTTNDEYLP